MAVFVTIQGISVMDRWRYGVPLMLLLAWGCQNKTEDSLSSDEQNRIVEEIEQTLDDYADANVRGDSDDILLFWSDSRGLTFSGDGAVPGGSEEWLAQRRENDEGLDRWLSWEWLKVQVEVLSRDAANCTLEFRIKKSWGDGDTLVIEGTATYVFRHDGGKWRATEIGGALAP